MAKQQLGAKKLKKASEIGGREYYACFARGGRTHTLVDCWFEDEDGDRMNIDWINIKTGEGPWPFYRKGKCVMPDASDASADPQSGTTG
ncbi:MAG: hypothetical protein IRY84_18215 [Thermobispora bispora]|nr:hypothetical protein [Thermobispora bispora]